MTLLPLGAVLTTVALALPLALASEGVAVDGCRLVAVQYTSSNQETLWYRKALPVVFFDTVDVAGLVTLEGADVSDLLSSADSVRFCLLGGGGFLAVMSFDDGLNIHSLLNATNTWHLSHH